jgi:(p)ppGpp synthase/HD superfamily hydrolase
MIDNEGMITSIPAAQLLIMPLHAITEIHGEAGLHRRLTLELDRLPTGTRRVVGDATAWAAQLHAHQRRTREPYLNHLLRVTLRVLCYYRITDPDVLVAAVLHDAVEDQPWSMIGRPTGHGPPPRDEALAVLTTRHGPRVARLVAALTNPEYGPGADRTRQYLEHLATALAGEPWARVIKLSDFTDNGVGIIHTIGPKVQRSARKYTGAVPVLRALLDRTDTPLDPSAKAHIHRQLDLAEQRFTAILAA